MPFNEILSLVSFSDLTHLILRMVSQFELAFRTNGENAKTLCLEKADSILLSGEKKKKFYVVQKAEGSLRAFT